MRFCQDHWESLRSAIRERGLYGFVAKSGEDVVSRMQGEAVGDESASTFEPLMGAHNAILSRIMELGGVEVMMPNPDGSERCPICYANEQHKAHCADSDCTYSYDHFIDKAADDALTEAKRRGLVASA